jgi:hypothetical protein
MKEYVLVIFASASLMLQQASRAGAEYIAAGSNSSSGPFARLPAGAEEELLLAMTAVVVDDPSLVRRDPFFDLLYLRLAESLWHKLHAHRRREDAFSTAPGSELQPAQSGSVGLSSAPSGPAGNVGASPEPGGLALAAMGAIGLMWRGRRKTK